jgi:hypothetical protein
MDELRTASTHLALPANILFFGIEAANTGDSDKLSPTLMERLPRLAKHLTCLIKTTKERLN